MSSDVRDNLPPIRVVQITDTHLGNALGDELLGLNADMSLGRVLELVASERGNDDVLLATGDLSNCGSLNSYQRFAEMSAHVAEHALWLPGNHDLPEVMAQARGPLQRSLRLNNWQILMLDSSVRGEVGGCFSEQELAFLERSLDESDAEHILVCLHHHPIKSGCEWLDEQQVSNAEAFFAVLDQSSLVRGVLWGHIHQQMDEERNGVKLMSTPSSCIQFAPGQQGFKLDQQNPGYRWLELCSDGHIKTAVSRISECFDLDYENSSGY